MIFGAYWWLLIPGFLLGIYAQIKLTAAYNKYLQVRTYSGLTGAQAAREILSDAGLVNVPVEEIGGRLTDHFDPGKKALFLSSENFHGQSISAVGVAAHEAGHALQQKAAYALFNLRMMLVPVTQIASMAWMGLFILGFILHLSRLIPIAIGIFAVMTLFQLVTLPVEFDASRRAKQQLLKLGLVRAEEGPAVSKVLSAAALTYVAALVTSMMQLLQFVMIARNDRR
ncbi:zinc metallopeptidase [Pedosphaera parvula]|uniref:Peptidase membrane zinc metallopeptidase putative n=1 Tax=Pedosphaera parvula (strain Ellin514) TaxID=320771 RepID=B9XGK8_PEDPL|nr:zinc metallopeptidase [Pedosphaera parvula]EEF61059.1 peptidase membrane zinc metallopeptidase putative [Pedosphaera parvula Ellin514]